MQLTYFNEACVWYLGIEAINKINEAIDGGDENATVEALQQPAAGLRDIDPVDALHYQITLARQKDKKAEVWVFSLVFTQLFLPHLTQISQMDLCFESQFVSTRS